MIELPRIDVSFVKDYQPPTLGIHIFEADSGPQQKVASACIPHGLSFKVEWYGLKPSELGMLMNFWEAILLDKRSGVSLKPFYIPRNHPFWKKVSTWSYVESLLVADTIDNAKWEIRDPSAVSTEVVNIHSWSCVVREIYA